MFLNRPLPTEDVKLEPQTTILRFAYFVVNIFVLNSLIEFLIKEAASFYPVTNQGFKKDKPVIRFNSCSINWDFILSCITKEFTLKKYWLSILSKDNNKSCQYKLSNNNTLLIVVNIRLKILLFSERLDYIFNFFIFMLLI